MQVRLFFLAVTTQVAQADEVATTKTPSVTEENQYQPATAAEILVEKQPYL